MTSTEQVSGTRTTLARRSFLGWFAGLCVIITVTLLTGVGVAALLAHEGEAADWSKWSDVGQSFGALSSIISGLALVVVVATARVQFREMRNSRKELEEQSHSMNNNHAELRRTVDAHHGMLHLQMLRMAIEDPSLTQVWPPFIPGLPPEINRQYLYANVIYQFHWTSLRLGNHTDEQVISSLRYLFTSQLMRDYWRAAEYARTSLESGSPEFLFAQKVDEVCRDYEAVAASASRTNEHGISLHECQNPAQAP
jgi:Family of unknown function (DUF6082)